MKKNDDEPEIDFWNIEAMIEYFETYTLIDKELKNPLLEFALNELNASPEDLKYLNELLTDDE